MIAYNILVLQIMFKNLISFELGFCKVWCDVKVNLMSYVYEILESFVLMKNILQNNYFFIVKSLRVIPIILSNPWYYFVMYFAFHMLFKKATHCPPHAPNFLRSL